jgi:hypothetical protein
MLWEGSTMKLHKTATAPLGMGLSAALLLSVAGCGQQEFRMPPYIVKKGCEFTLVIGSDKSVSATVPANRNRVTQELSIGSYSIGVSGCEVVDNPNGLPIYED